VLFSQRMSALPFAFAKYEGLGNDFVVIDAADESLVDAALAARLCDRRRGIGADGVLLALPPRAPGTHARMKVVNADGSVPEMCGNGLRCLALHLAPKLHVHELSIETDAGVRRCSVDGADVTVDMGTVTCSGVRSLRVDGGSLDVWIANAGNPHAVLFGQRERSDVLALGPKIATHPDFPAGTNVEFATVTGRAVDLTVWERGVGLTLACGTGACATVAVACERGMLPRGEAIPVRLPGGVLAVAVDEAGRATMRGPARLVFSGEVAGAGPADRG
jgi:diaminopimelate epimerase